MGCCRVLFPGSLADQVAAGWGVGGQDQWQQGDVIFTKGVNGQIYTGGAGHVGILAEDSVIHACSKNGGVVEDPLGSFLSDYELVTVRRAVWSCL